MRSVSMLTLSVALCLLVFTGCETTKSLSGKLTSKVSSMTSSTDEELFAQVPESEREDVQKAAFALKVSEEKLKLAELKIELADLQKNQAEYEEELADKFNKEAQLALDLAKLEAIDRSDLGDKEDNIKKKAGLRSKQLGVEADRVQIEAKVATSKRQIDQLIEQIEKQKETIESIESGKDMNMEADSYKQETLTPPEKEEGLPVQ